MSSKMKKDIMNNYVFQNKFKAYFSDELYKVLECIDLRKGKERDYVCSCLKINGAFNGKIREISFPNVFSYAYSVKRMPIDSLSDFGKFNFACNTMKVDFKNRKFKSNSYTESLDTRITLLMNEYEYMYKIDLKSFYKSIYTHIFEHLDDNNLKDVDKYIRGFNKGKTNGIVLGNILSTCAANEVMYQIVIDLQKLLENTRIEFFSDQIYIFYNGLNYSGDNIIEKVSSILKKDYFEFIINYNDSKIFTHETLIKEKRFSKSVDRLFKVQKWKAEDDFQDWKFSENDLNISNENLLHFFNALSEELYDFDVSRRNAYVEVSLKRVFSSPLNVVRLIYAMKTSETDRIQNILYMFLRNFPSLVILLLELGIMDRLIEHTNDKEKYFSIFCNHLVTNITTIEAVYYAHICFKIAPSKFKKYYRENLKRKNILLHSIYVATFNVTHPQAITKSLGETNGDWGDELLYRYTLLLNSGDKIHKANGGDLSPLENAINNSLDKKIRLLKGFNYELCSLEKLKKINELETYFHYKEFSRLKEIVK